jgi:hypothetical protein
MPLPFLARYARGPQELGSALRNSTKVTKVERETTDDVTDD